MHASGKEWASRQAQEEVRNREKQREKGRDREKGNKGERAQRKQRKCGCSEKNCHKKLCDFWDCCPHYFDTVISHFPM